MIRFFWLALLAPLVMRAAEPATPTAGVKPPSELLAQARPALEAGRKAMQARDLPALQAAIAEATRVLGPWAGNPETATPYFPPPDTTPFSAASVRDTWAREIQRGVRGVEWRKNPSGDPTKMEAGLRAAARPLSALARTAAVFPEKKPELMAEVKRGADWLLARQHASGGFPMPTGPGLHPREKVGWLVQRLMAARPDLVVDGWITTDPGDGGLQFDHGLCGTALVDAWELTRDQRYLEGARRAAAWALAQPLAGNWNYNAFSVGFLARLARATGEGAYLEGAVDKARFGVMPGQLPTGRWVDAHNACAVYHNILLRDLLELWAALPAEHPARPEVLVVLTRGLDQAAAETNSRGFTGTWTANFARALQLLGEKPAWRTALNVCVNAALTGKAKGLGDEAVAVLELARPPEA